MKTEFIGVVGTLVEIKDGIRKGWISVFSEVPQLIGEENISWEVGAMIKPSCVKHMSASIREVPCILGGTTPSFVG
jgi:hypothetical protein